ncbi:MAG: hypothetical protein ABSA59_02235 [Terriglobia bacterium]|jgi:hypothetical protein
MANTVQVPAELFRKLLQAEKALDKFHEAFEDFLITHDPTLLRELRQARREHLAGKTRPFEEFEQELSYKSRRR